MLRAALKQFYIDTGKSMFTVENNINKTQLKIEVKGKRKSSLTPFLSIFVLSNFIDFFSAFTVISTDICNDKSAKMCFLF